MFTSWFGRLELDGIADGTALLSVPTKFLKSWIQSHYQERILKVLSSEVPEILGLSITVRSSSRLMPQRPQAFQGTLGEPVERHDDVPAAARTPFFPSAETPRPDSRDAGLLGRRCPHGLSARQAHELRDLPCRAIEPARACRRPA